MDEENNQNQENPLNQDPYQSPVPLEDNKPENIFSENNSVESSEKVPRVYKLWHLIAALGLGSVLTASVFLLPSFGGQGFIGGQLPAVDNISPSADFSLFTGALTPGLNNFTGELTPALTNPTAPATTPVIPQASSPVADFETVTTTTSTIPQASSPVADFETVTTTTSTIPQASSPVADFEDVPVHTITSPVTVPQYTIVQPTETAVSSPLTAPQSTIVQPVIEYKNIPIPTNYTLKAIQ